MQQLFQLLPDWWQNQLEDLTSEFNKIDEKLDQTPFLPKREFIFNALQQPQAAKVLIIGQDPYPNPDFAMGLAFSVPKEAGKLPSSLRNIFSELNGDLQTPLRTNGDLSDWKDQGVVLLNRTLTLNPGLRNSHSKIGWKKITERIVQTLAQQRVVAILWGNSAQELAPYFPESHRICSSHPSPLSAYRGFFGSKPFSRTNQQLVAQGKTPIHWG